MQINGKKQILLWGEDAALMRVIERYIRFQPALSQYTVSAQIEYGHTSLITGSMLQNADTVMYGLFRRYGMRVRAEGVPALKPRVTCGKQGLIYCVGISEIASNPLVWDIISDFPLEKKLADLETISDKQSYMHELQIYFKSSIFSVDGHEK
ncbi:MAG: hypothetical protein PF692_01585 [Kiritimatiellae bacterium]|jgi:hypothetical protein|nr:hypothetical protein [Kiritimatiellia bacterium]